MTELKFTLTPFQRFLLIELFGKSQEKIPDAATGKLFRATYKALGLSPIQTTAENYKGELSTQQLLDKKLSVFSLKQDQAGYIVSRVMTVERNSGVELSLGDFFDLVEEFSTTGGSTNVVADDVMLYDPKSENWTPPEKDTKGQLIAAMGQMAGAPLEQRKDIWKELVEKNTLAKVQGILDELIDEIRASVLVVE
jgi:hypothetical protein